MQPLDALLFLAPFLALVALDRWALREESRDLRRPIRAQWLVLVGVPESLGIAVAVAGRVDVGARVAAALGLLVVAGITPTWSEWRSFRRSLAMLVDSGDPERLRAMIACLDRTCAERGRWHQMARAITAAEALGKRVRIVEAEAILAHVGAQRLPPEWAYQVVYQRAFLALFASQAERVREVLASVDRPAPNTSWEERLQLAEALADVLEGRSARAIERASSHSRGPHAAYWLAVRAHAQASAGDHEAARATLCELRARKDPRCDLAQVASMQFPASRLAAELLRGEPHPFR